MNISKKKAGIYVKIQLQFYNANGIIMILEYYAVIYSSILTQKSLEVVE